MKLYPLNIVRLSTASLVLFIGVALAPCRVRGEAMIQYFNTSWNEIAQKMPELAETGYDSLWLPPPTKGSGGLSVGYDLFDRFDLGGKDQRGTVSTRYGTEADLLRLVETAHRFGIRVYFDNIMNHNAFDVPGYNADTPIDVYPGFVPEDFHLRVTSDGYYRKWDNVSDWNDTWQVQHRNFSDLIDIAQEPGSTNQNFGGTEGSTFPKIKFLRQPNNPEYYCYDANGNYVGFGPNNGLTAQYLQDHAGYYSEYVQDFLNRSARWIMDRTKADGLRLDAVKHVPYDFFGASYGADKDYSDYGYLGQAQRQFAISRGFNDKKFNYGGIGTSVNLRETVFDTEKPRHNAMMFGEHLGEPPAYSDYFAAGMRLVDNTLQSNMNSILGNPSATLSGLDAAGSFSFGVSLGVMYAQSHDNDYASRRELQHALYMTRAGLGNIYTDGNHQAQTLNQSGGAFPRHANTNFLGQFGDNKIPNLVYIHNQFARGRAEYRDQNGKIQYREQIGRYSDNDFVAYERIDKRENLDMSDEDGVTMLFLMNDNYASGQGRNFNTSFGHTPLGDNAYLYNYSSYGGGFYKYASDIVNGSTLVPPGGYFAFSWKNPDPSDLWTGGGGKAITILQSGQQAGTLTYTRKDGPDGDPNFNPYGVAGAVAGSYSYPYTIPRVTDVSNLSFVVRTDGSAENILLQLDGGVDLNGTGNTNDPTGKRDYPPGISTDVFAGYEQPTYIDRIGPEKFAATNAVDAGTSRCTFGSAGAETYTSGGTTVNGSGTNPQDGAAPTFVYHDPNAGFGDWSGTHPATQLVDKGSTFDIWAKTNSVGAGFRMFVYYTSDGSNPEGAGGVGLGTTSTAEMFYNAPNDSSGNNWWGKATINRPAGTLKYKIGIYKTGQPSQFPSDAASVARKTKMMTTFKVTGFNGTTKVFYPHNDFGATQTGLSEGFHVLRARAFLDRGGKASIYNTFTQAFYYDGQLPQGEVKFPAQNDSIGGQQYGVVARTDPSVTEVWYKIVDSDASNDDSATGVANGNNAWVQASSVTPGVNSAGVPSISSVYPNEWRFNYVNIPSSGNAQILVRLRELSSAAMTAANAVNDTSADASSHWTTLVRNVSTAGPNLRLFVAYPQSDGTVVDSSYILKVWFTKALADNTTTDQLKSRFVINIKSSDSPSDPGVVQPQSGYSINYNVSNDYHELAYTLPNLYNGNPDFLHTITVTYANSGSPTLVGTRRVKAQPVTVIKNNIITPPEVDSDGKSYVIVLPDVASPTAAQRTVPIQVETDTTATGVAINFVYGSGTVALDPGISPNPSSDGSRQLWNFAWTGVIPGTYSFTSTVTTPTGSAVSTRNATVVYQQIVIPDPNNPNKQDVDDDGLGYYTYDTNVGPVPIESTKIPLPTTNSETWTNGQVHIWAISGKTDPLNPDTDNDGLSDGLELGWGTAVGDTNTATDTNGDGVKNFQPDLDPPIFNTTDNAGAPANYGYFNPWPYNLNNSRTDLIAGTMTDPTNPDTDGDGLNDGLEDRTYAITRDGSGVPTAFQLVHNGRVDILPNGVDGEQVIAHPPTIYNTSIIDRSKVLATSPNAVWLETDPNNGDTSGGGLSDGSKDSNGNGIVDLAIIDRNQTVNGNYVVLAALDDFKKSVTVTGSAPGSTAATFRYADFCYTYTQLTDAVLYTSTALSRTKLDAVFRPGGNFRSDGLDVIWLETDPRRYSTSGDGLPDGWKVRYGLDPWDDGVAGHYNLHTGKPSNAVNGVNGNPSGDGVTTNLIAYTNGTDPRVPLGTPPPPVGSITIGPVTASAVVTKGAVTNRKEFTDWTADDLIALDYYDGDGPNNQGSDIYHAYDGFDSSRDLVAFYAHDGGDPISSGDDKFYFRVDMNDLQAQAEQGNLDIYVAINFGNPGTGEYNLPDQIDTGTTMKWQVVVACYQTNSGRVYLWDKTRVGPTAHSTAIGQDLSQFNVTSRDQNTPNGFGSCYYNSDLDAVEFSISRQALIAAGWDGVDATKLIYQVYTTKDGTQNSPTVGAGDIGGRSDIRDSIRNDWIASDYYNDQQNIAGAKSVLNSWVGLQADNDRGKSVKVIPLIHGNQAILPGSSVQSLINNSAGAGYYRPLDVHDAFGVPLTLHITPTLASAIQWAAVSPSSSATHGYVDGPAFNTRLKTLALSGLVDILGSTFSDHILPYFSKPFNTDNVSLANDFLNTIYGSVSPNVFWTPERVSNDDVLDKISNLGFQYTFVDQLRHLFKWFGRTPALGTDAYRINQINAMKCFVINDGLGQYMFQNTDNGTPWQLRQLLEHRARVGPNDQVVVLMNSWEDFAVKANADAYDKNIAWLASHPWIKIVTPDQIVSGQVPYLDGSHNTQTTWGAANRGTGLALAKVAKDWIDHATEENYDNWYNGSAFEESLGAKVFNIRTGVPLPNSYGLVSSAGVVKSAWDSVTGLSGANVALSKLARGVLHASVFETAFHNQTANDLTKFSTGAYVTPDTTVQTLAGFSKYAQSQSRFAAIYSRVDAWANAAKTGAYDTSSVAEQSDVDLDGENEYLLYNDRVFALFEKIGGRLTNAWVRDLDTNAIQQIVGNPLSYSGSETEEEGTANIVSGAVGAYRTSAFKDWFPFDASSNSYVNQVYAVQQAGTGWKFTSPDGRIAKTISLNPRATVLNALYQLTNISTLYVRHGLSPNLSDLLTNGQKNLPGLANDGVASELNLFNTSGNQTRTFIRYGGTGLSGASPNLSAVDRDTGVVFDTVNMRNQAQTQQVEMSGGNNMTFALGLQTGSTISFSTAHDGIPDWWKIKYFGAGVDLNNANFGSALAPAGDGKSNLQKWVLGEDPTVANYNNVQVRISRNISGQATLQFPTLLDRVYRIYYKDSLNAATWTAITPDINGSGSDATWADPATPASGPRFYRVSIVARIQP